MNWSKNLHSRRDFIKRSALASGELLIHKSDVETTTDEEKTELKLPDAQPAGEESILAPVDLSPAKWIWYPMGRCLANTMILFRKSFKIGVKPVTARGYILADSRYKLTVNGRRVQWGPAPSDPRWMEADPLALADSFSLGENVIGCSVLYFGLGDGTSPMGKPGLIFNLDIELADGSSVKISSDESWLAYLARSWRPGNYKRWYLRSFQEEFDARLYPYGWDTAQYMPDKSWLSSKVYGGYSNKPSVCSGTPEYLWEISGDRNVCAIRKRSVPLMNEVMIGGFEIIEAAWVSWKRPADEYFESITPDAFDYEWADLPKTAGGGQWEIDVRERQAAVLTFACKEQMVGWPNFVIDAPEGTIVEVLVHEAHKPGSVVFLNTHFNSWTRFICREGENNFETFDFESYRWIQFHIRNYNRKVTLKRIKTRRRVYPWSFMPDISTDDRVLQRVFDASINTLNNCAQDTIVDGMARERQQYSGDGSHQLHAIYYCFGAFRLGARFVNTFGQGLGTVGVFMDSWPAFDRLARIMERQMQLTGWGPIVDHSVGFCFDSWYYFLYTGKTDALKETYPRLLTFFLYLKKLLGQGKLIPVEGIGLPTVWMDHFAYKKQRHKECAFNLYVAAMCKHALSKLCSEFGDPDWKREIFDFGDKIEKACVKKYWSNDKKAFVCNLPWVKEEGEIRYDDRSLATSIIYDQCPRNDFTESIKILEKCPGNMGFSYPCNSVWRYWALVKGNAIQPVIDDLRTRWYSMSSVIENNTIQEMWHVSHDSGDQWSHCAVAPLIMLYQGIIGVSPLKPGFEKCLIYPRLGDIGDLSLRVNTIKGVIQFETSGSLSDRRTSILIPDGMQCEIALEQRERIDLERGIEVVGNGRITYVLPSGKSTHLHTRYL